MAYCCRGRGLRSTSRHALGHVITGNEDVLDVIGDSSLEPQDDNGGVHLHPVVVIDRRAWLWCRQSCQHGQGCWTWGRPFATWFSIAGSCVVQIQHDGNMEKDANGFDMVDTDMTIHGEGGWRKWGWDNVQRNVLILWWFTDTTIQ